MFGIADNHEFLAALGIENAPNRDVIIANLEKIAQQKLTIKISERLTAAQLEEFNSIVDEGNLPIGLTIIFLTFRIWSLNLFRKWRMKYYQLKKPCSADRIKIWK